MQLANHVCWCFREYCMQACIWYSKVFVKCVLNVPLCPTVPLVLGGQDLPWGPHHQCPLQAPVSERGEFNYQVFISVSKAIQTVNQSNKQVKITVLVAIFVYCTVLNFLEIGLGQD